MRDVNNSYNWIWYNQANPLVPNMYVCVGNFLDRWHHEDPGRRLYIVKGAFCAGWGYGGPIIVIFFQSGLPNLKKNSIHWRCGELEAKLTNSGAYSIYCRTVPGFCITIPNMYFLFLFAQSQRPSLYVGGGWGGGIRNVPPEHGLGRTWRHRRSDVYSCLRDDSLSSSLGPNWGPPETPCSTVLSYLSTVQSYQR